MRGRIRRGFVLVTVVWFLTGVSVLAMAASLMARGGLATSHNRVEQMRAHWRAEDCIARAFAAIDDATTADSVAARDAREYTRSVRESAAVRSCAGTVTLEPLGLAVDLNRANERLLKRVIMNRGVPEASADSLVSALLDWRDADDSTRALGAERDWYARRGEIEPRNGDLADTLELRLVRGFDYWLRRTDVGISHVLTTERGRVLLGVAPLAVVAALPGLNFAAAIALEEHLGAGAQHLPELLSLVGMVPPEARAPLMSAIGELGEVATVRPDAWILLARASGAMEDSRGTRSVATIELRLVQDGGRLAVVRRRLTP